MNIGLTKEKKRLFFWLNLSTRELIIVSLAASGGGSAMMLLNNLLFGL